jgi:ribosome-associated heat shock protein Hsp15
VADQAARIDVWMWRARFFKTRSQAAAKAGEGAIRIRRGGESGRIDKASRTVRVGDELTFAIANRVIAVRVLALGARRGPAVEAQSLYARLEEN